MSKNPAFKSDKYRKARGGHSRWLSLSCGNCKTSLMIYQKDGPGILKRLYLDRIISPKVFSTKKKLECKKCKAVLGVLAIYKKEKRSAYRLFVGAVGKRIMKGNKLS